LARVSPDSNVLVILGDEDLAKQVDIGVVVVKLGVD
jgi:hypothetical protein